MKPIVVIRHQTSAPLGIAAAALDKARVPWRYLDVWKASEWPDIDDVSGLIALGGAMNANQMGAHPFLQRVRSVSPELIRRRLGNGAGRDGDSPR